MPAVKGRSERSEQALYTAGFTLLALSVPAIFVNSVLRSSLFTVAITVGLVAGVVLIVLAISRAGSPVGRFREMGTRSKVSFATVLIAAVLLVVTIPLGLQVVYYTVAVVSIIALGMLASSLRHDQEDRRRQTR